MTFVKLILLAGVSLLILACNKSEVADNQASPVVAGSPASAQADELATARANFNQRCSNCHGGDGAGGPVKLDDGATLKVPSLREGHALRHKDEDFVKQITHGGEGMPKFGDKLSRAEIIALTLFIRKEFQPQ